MSTTDTPITQPSPGMIWKRKRSGIYKTLKLESMKLMKQTESWGDALVSITGKQIKVVHQGHGASGLIRSSWRSRLACFHVHPWSIESLIAKIHSNFSDWQCVILCSVQSKRSSVAPDSLHQSEKNQQTTENDCGRDHHQWRNVEVGNYRPNACKRMLWVKPWWIRQLIIRE